MNEKTKKYLIVGGAIVLGLYGYRMLMRKLNKPSELPNLYGIIAPVSTIVLFGQCFCK